MMRTHKDFMASLPRKRRTAIHSRAAEILAEEMSLQELRKALDRSQETTAEALGLKQSAVSRLGSRDDMRISTLREYAHALGGELEFYVRFKEQVQRPALFALGLNARTNTQRLDVVPGSCG